MQIDKFVIGLVVFGLVLLSGVLMIVDTDNNYDDFNLTSDESSSFTNLQTRANEILNTTDEMTEEQKNEIIGSNGSVESDAAWESMIKGGYSAIKVTSGSFGLANDALGTVQEELKFPSYFKNAAFGIIVLLVVFALIYMVFRYKG